MVENLLELRGSSGALMRCEKRLAPDVNGIKKEIHGLSSASKFVGRSRC